LQPFALQRGRLRPVGLQRRLTLGRAVRRGVLQLDDEAARRGRMGRRGEPQLRSKGLTAETATVFNEAGVSLPSS
jgi:hypothetical protein